MGERGGDLSDFRARAGTMTVIFITSSANHELILRILAEALNGGHLRQDRFEYEPTDEDLASMELPEVELDPDPPIGPDTQLQVTPAGRELLFVGSAVQRWLANAPGGPRYLGQGAAGDALMSLVCCWSATVVHALAEGPRTLHDLSQIVDVLAYETLEEHVEALERNGLVEARGHRFKTRYAATPWLREGIAPLLAAARLERRNPTEGVAPIDALDAGAALMLALPLVELPPGSGSACRLRVELYDGSAAGAVARVEAEGLVSGDLGIELEEVGSSATSTIGGWLDAMILGEAGQVRTDGDHSLPEALLDGLHRALFGRAR